MCVCVVTGRSNYDICGCLFAEAQPGLLSSFPLRHTRMHVYIHTHTYTHLYMYPKTKHLGLNTFFNLSVYAAFSVSQLTSRKSGSSLSRGGAVHIRCTLAACRRHHIISTSASRAALLRQSAKSSEECVSCGRC